GSCTGDSCVSWIYSGSVRMMSCATNVMFSNRSGCYGDDESNFICSCQYLKIVVFYELGNVEQCKMQQLLDRRCIFGSKRTTTDFMFCIKFFKVQGSIVQYF
ncbi:hypothetical protein PENTCL1PPCAC_21655, partial [Pristionchus entomophagus]